jgi:hypothetical protein
MADRPPYLAIVVVVMRGDQWMEVDRDRWDLWELGVVGT